MTMRLGGFKLCDIRGNRRDVKSSSGTMSYRTLIAKPKDETNRIIQSSNWRYKLLNLYMVPTVRANVESRADAMVPDHAGEIPEPLAGA